MFISHSEAQKLDHSIKEINTMQEEEEEPTVHCPIFELFQTTIGIGTTPRTETEVIGIKCQSGRAALLREFLLKSNGTVEKAGLGKFIPAGLANVIGIELMQTIIRQNNQFLKTITYIPINGIPSETLQTKIIIDEEEKEEDQTKMMVIDYFLSAPWCHGFEPTDREGRYFLITTHAQLSEAHEWLDENLESLFTEHIPQYQTFKPIEGYDLATNLARTLTNYAHSIPAVHRAFPKTPNGINHRQTTLIAPTTVPSHMIQTNTLNCHNRKNPNVIKMGNRNCPKPHQQQNLFPPTPKPRKHSETKSPLILKKT